MKYDENIRLRSHTRAATSGSQLFFKVFQNVRNAKVFLKNFPDDYFVDPMVQKIINLSKCDIFTKLVDKSSSLQKLYKKLKKY